MVGGGEKRHSDRNAEAHAMISSGKRSVFFAAIFLVSAARAIAAESDSSTDTAPHWRSTSPIGSKVRISKLKWESVERDSDNDKKILITGKYLRKDWALVAGHITLVRSDDDNREFVYEAYAVAPVTTITLYAIGPLGEVETEIYELTLGRKSRKKTAATRFQIIPSIGATSVAYQETGVAEFSRIALTGKLSLGGPLFLRRFEWGANAFATILPVKSETADTTVRFLGANLRAGYLVTNPESDWALTLSGGISFSTMLVSNPVLGYSGLLYPQFYPYLRRKISPITSVGLYAKYVSLGRDNWLSFADRELASGLNLTQILPGRRLWNVSLDYSDLKLSLSATKVYHVRSFSLSAGYGF